MLTGSQFSFSRILVQISDNLKFKQNMKLSQFSFSRILVQIQVTNPRPFNFIRLNSPFHEYWFRYIKYASNRICLPVSILLFTNTGLDIMNILGYWGTQQSQFSFSRILVQIISTTPTKQLYFVGLNSPFHEYWFRFDVFGNIRLLSMRSQFSFSRILVQIP